MSHVRNAILEHLKSGGVITKITAIAPPFSTTNLGDKILHLRRAGHDIRRRWCKNENTGSRWAEFYMEPKPSRTVLCFEGEEYGLTT